MIITLNDKTYAFSLNKILDFCQSGEKSRETEIIDTYEMDEHNTPKAVNKQTREVKNNQPTQNENIRYDLIKMLITTLLENNNAAGNEIDMEPFDLGTSLAFNTLLSDNFIYEINE